MRFIIIFPIQIAVVGGIPHFQTRPKGWSKHSDGKKAYLSGHDPVNIPLYPQKKYIPYLFIYICLYIMYGFFYGIVLGIYNIIYIYMKKNMSMGIPMELPIEHVATPRPPKTTAPTSLATAAEQGSHALRHEPTHQDLGIPMGYQWDTNMDPIPISMDL